jgi:hypothetical protein
MSCCTHLFYAITYGVVCGMGGGCVPTTHYVSGWIFMCGARARSWILLGSIHIMSFPHQHILIINQWRIKLAKKMECIGIYTTVLKAVLWFSAGTPTLKSTWRRW